MMVYVVGMIGAMWGSFLNMAAYRLLHDESFLIARSFCPHCKKTIAWYDLVPVASFLLLQGQCRQCHEPILWLYPFIELMSGVVAVVLWQDYLHALSPTSYYAVARLGCYSILFSGLLIMTRTDFEALVFPRSVLFALIPVGIAGSALGIFPVTLQGSLIGGVIGFGALWLMGALFWYLFGKEGIGEGDRELLGVLGLFFGPLGIWSIMLIGSLVGATAGICYLFLTGQDRDTRIPFGPFLALGALGYVYAGDWLVALLLR